ncbi:MAG: hypothetical protein Q4C13_05920, partial [Clostridia bacterium]|nr:hypothetical protein [Clostridia bacterium]
MKNEKRSDSLNEALKRREAREREQLLTEVEAGGERVMALDDTQRVKVLSPGRLVTKRFFRNKLAIVGLCILIAMFTFAFLCPIFYPYSQTQIFYKYGTLNVNYASATERTEAVSYQVDEAFDIHYSVSNRMNSYITELESSGAEEVFAYDPDGVEYVVSKLGDRVYTLSMNESSEIAEYHEQATVATYNALGGIFLWQGAEMDEAFQEAAAAAVDGGLSGFTYEDESYTVSAVSRSRYDIIRSGAG